MAVAQLETPTEVFDRLNKYVWIIRILYRDEDGEFQVHYGTGFALGENGLLVTCATLFDGINPTDISVRRKDDTFFRYKAEKVVEDDHTLGILFVNIVGFKDCPTAPLAEDGSLSYFADVIHIGHPKRMVWSFLTGRVAYPCIDRPPMPEEFQYTGPCQRHNPISVVQTPTHRVMGDVWNAYNLLNKEGEVHEDRSFEAQLNPKIPVIQMFGFPTNETAYGGPVFNQKHQVVGMMAPSPEGDFVYAIHISMLKHLLQKVVKKRPAPPLEMGESSASKKLKEH